MPTSGPHNASTFTSDLVNGGNSAWSAPANAGVSDNVNAACIGGFFGALSEYIKALDIAGFDDIADDAIVSQITVEVERRTTSASKAVDSEAKLVVAGVVQPDNAAQGGFWPLADTYISYTFPVSLTGAQVKSPTFGFVLAATLLQNATATVDHIRFTATYTVPENPPAAEGCISLIEQTAANTLADAEAFRDWCGASTRAEALEHIHFGSLPDLPANGEEYTKAELEAYRPFAILFGRDGRRNFHASGQSYTYTQEGMLGVLLEQETPAGSVTEAEEAERLWNNTVGKIIDDVSALGGKGGYLAMSAVSWGEPVRTHPDDVPTLGDAQQFWIGLHYGRQGR